MAERVKNGNGRLQALRPVPLRSPAVQTARRELSWLWSRESLLRLALSLVLATALWLYVTGKENPSYVDFAQPIPITPIPPSGNLIVTSQLGNVHIRYHPSNPNVFPTGATFTASVNLLNLGPGRHTVPVEVAVIDPGFSVVQVSPSRVTVVIEQKLQTHVKVVVRYFPGSRNPEAGYYALPAQTNPNVVTVTGPRSVVRQVADVAVTQGLSGAATTILTSQHPVPENSQGTPLPSSAGLTIEPSLVSVTIPIKAVGGVKTLPVAVTLVGHPKVGFGVTGVSVDPPTITAFGSPRSLNEIASLPARVDVTGRSAGSFRKRVTLHLPRGVTANTRSATVSFQIGALSTSAALPVAVSPVGVTPGLQAQCQPSKVQVIVQGPSTALAQAARSIQATVNLTNFALGFYTQAPLITVPPGFKVESFLPQTVNCGITASR